jgi:hypothetical protein
MVKTEERDRPIEKQIVMTPEMVKAGASVLRHYYACLAQTLRISPYWRLQRW